MPWFIEGPKTEAAPQLTYGAPATFNIDENSQEIIATGNSPRYISISVPANAAPIYVSYGSAVDVSAGNYAYILPAKFQNNKMEMPSQAIFMATSAAGKSADIIVAIATEG